MERCSILHRQNREEILKIGYHPYRLRPAAWHWPEYCYWACYNVCDNEMGFKMVGVVLGLNTKLGLGLFPFPIEHVPSSQLNYEVILNEK